MFLYRNSRQCACNQVQTLSRVALSHIKHNTRLLQSDMFSPTGNTAFGLAEGWRSHSILFQHIEDVATDSSVMTVFGLISIHAGNLDESTVSTIE